MLIFLYIVLCLLVTFYQLCYMFNNIYDITHIGNRVFYISLVLIVPIVVIGGWMHIFWYILVQVATYIISLILWGILYRWYHNKRFGPPKNKPSSVQYMQEEPTTSTITPNSEEITIPSASSNTKEQKPQYIKIQFKKTTALIATLCFLLCSSIGLNIYQAFYIKTTKESLITAENKYNRTSESADRARITINEKNEEIENLHDIISFYERYIVILPNDNSGTYHIYGCKHCDTTSFWVYTIDNAKAAGYHHCNDCCTLIEDLYRFNLR